MCVTWNWMAPLAPFLAEELYQNLVCSVDKEAPDSVHLSDYPTVDDSMVDQPLMEATRLAMRIASLGRGARSKAGVRVRQPLTSVMIKTRTPSEEAYLDLIRPQVLEELNIKEMRGLDDDLAAKVETLAKANDQSEGVFEVGDNHWVALEGGYVVVVDAAMTPALAQEGLARELVHRIQNLRRTAQFELTDHIVTYYQAPDEIAKVLTGSFADYVRQETLTEELVAGPPPAEAKADTNKVAGIEVTLGVRRI